MSVALWGLAVSDVVVGASTHRPADPLPEKVVTLGRVWIRVDEFYATLEAASARANKLRARYGTSFIVLRGMKGTVQCFALYSIPYPPQDETGIHGNT